jgi:hypothetical protein
MNELERWVNFFLLMAAASSTLIGLSFVVITLAAERRPEHSAKIPIYITPPFIGYSAVLFLAALLIFPNHTRFTAALSMWVVGGIGLVYSGSFLVRPGVWKSYFEQHDFIAYAAIPFAAYGAVIWGGVLTYYDPTNGLTLVAVGMLCLLANAIRNSWAIAVGVVSRPSGSEDSK